MRAPRGLGAQPTRHGCGEAVLVDDDVGRAARQTSRRQANSTLPSPGHARVVNGRAPEQERIEPGRRRGLRRLHLAHGLGRAVRDGIGGRLVVAAAAAGDDQCRQGRGLRTDAARAVPLWLRAVSDEALPGCCRPAASARSTPPKARSVRSHSRRRPRASAAAVDQVELGRARRVDPPFGDRRRPSATGCARASSTTTSTARAASSSCANAAPPPSTATRSITLRTAVALGPSGCERDWARFRGDLQHSPHE